MKIACISLGCPKNQVDLDVMVHILLSAGHETVADLAEADVILVNTCGFIESAKTEAIDHVAQAEFISDGQALSLEGSCFEHFCETSLGSDPAKHRLLLEIIGYTLCNTVKGKSLFLLIGERDCGKSVVINLLAEMLPPDKITNFTLGQCGDN